MPITLIAAREYSEMVKYSSVNPWIYIRQVAPELCTEHSIGRDSDKIISAMLDFISTRCIFGPEHEIDRSVLATELCKKIATKVSQMDTYLKDNCFLNSKSKYYNILNIVLTYRLGAEHNTNTNKLTGVTLDTMMQEGKSSLAFPSCEFS